MKELEGKCIKLEGINHLLDSNLKVFSREHDEHVTKYKVEAEDLRNQLQLSTIELSKTNHILQKIVGSSAWTVFGESEEFLFLTQ